MCRRPRTPLSWAFFIAYVEKDLMEKYNKEADIFQEPEATRNYKYRNPKFSQFCVHPYAAYPTTPLDLDKVRSFIDAVTATTTKTLCTRVDYNYAYHFFDVTIDTTCSAPLLTKLQDLGLRVVSQSTWGWDLSTKPKTEIPRLRVWIYAVDAAAPTWYQRHKEYNDVVATSVRRGRELPTLELREVHKQEAVAKRPLTNAEIKDIRNTLT